MKFFIAITLILHFCFASKTVTYDFYSHLTKLRSYVENNENVTSVLRDINNETNELLIKSGCNTSIMTDYQSFLGKVSNILSTHTALVDKSSPEFLSFADNLIKIISKSTASAVSDHFTDMLGVISMTRDRGNNDIVNRFINIIPSLCFNMNSTQMELAISKLAKSIRPSTNRKETIEKRINEYDQMDVFEDQNSFLKDFFAVSDGQTRIYDSHFFVKIVKNLQKVEFESNSQTLTSVLSSLVKILMKQRNDEKLTEVTIDFLLSYKVAAVLRNLETNDNYFFLIYLSWNNSKYFRLKLREMPEDVNVFLSNYLCHLSVILRFYHLTAVFYQFSEEFTASDIESAISAFKQLRELYKTDKLVFKLIKKDRSEIGFQLQKVLAKIYNDSSHELNFITSKLGFYLAFIGTECMEGSFLHFDSADVIGSVGRLIVISGKDKSLDISEELDLITPIFDELLKNTLKAFEYNFEVIRKYDFPFFMACIQFHPSETARPIYTDMFLSKYISSNSASGCVNFAAINHMNISDKRGVYVNSFISVLENYLKTPSEAKLTYLREFYSFLKKEQLLSKTEISLIENRTSIKALRKRKY